ncbi:MAG: TetR/AcrR family transcriptional regulator [Micrococcaceae bacterium]
MRKNTRGRPRSRASQEAVLRAAVELLEEQGFEAMTMEGIAGRAEVSKQTVYRWWGSKADVVVEALSTGYFPGTMPIIQTSGEGREDLRADVRTWLDAMRESIACEEDAPLIQAVLVALAGGSEQSSAVHQWLVLPLRQGLEQRFIAHDRRHPGTLPVPPEFLAELLAGSLLLRLMFAEPTSQEWADQLLDFVSPAPRPE